MLWHLSVPGTLMDLESWIEQNFAGLGRALRREEDTSLPFEPWMSMEEAKGLVRQAVKEFCENSNGP